VYLLKVVELGEGEVRCPDGGPPLLPHDAQAHVGLL